MGNAITYLHLEFGRFMIVRYFVMRYFAGGRRAYFGVGVVPLWNNDLSGARSDRGWGPRQSRRVILMMIAFMRRKCCLLGLLRDPRISLCFFEFSVTSRTNEVLLYGSRSGHPIGDWAWRSLGGTCVI